MQLQFDVLTIIWLLPSLITLVVLRIKRRPWEKISSILGWKLGSPVYYLWALLIFLLTALPVILVALFVFPDLYRHPSHEVSLYSYAHLGLSFFSILSAFVNEFFFTALGKDLILQQRREEALACSRCRSACAC